MKNFIKPILIASGILLFTSCGESPSVKKLVDLQPEEKQAVLTMSGQFNTLLRQKTTLGFIKTAMLQTDKASFMIDYLSPSFNSEQNKMAKVIIGHLFKDKANVDLRAKTDDDFFTLSPTVEHLTKQLTGNMKDVMLVSHSEGLSTDQLTAKLKSVIGNFKAEAQENASLTFDESRALIAFAEFQSN
jgi:hypothetical protein